MTRFVFIALLPFAIIALAAVGVGRADDVMREDFEGAWPPEGWTVLSFGDTHSWEPTTDLAHEGDASAWIEFGPSGTAQDEWLVSGPVDLSGMSQAFFEFYEDGAYWDEWGDRHYIMVGAGSQTEVGSFVVALDMRPGVHEQQTFGGQPVRADDQAVGQVGEAAADFTLTDTDGITRMMSDHAGEVLFFWFIGYS